MIAFPETESEFRQYASLPGLWACCECPFAGTFYEAADHSAAEHLDGEIAYLGEEAEA